ncbi:5-oxoprolinase subunit PxpB [Gallibacterium anatis]|uniref:Carboxyltransferase domain-containing protein n=1 Tax=Gallibacterium anatis 4895 TaxID=1396510 RepID=A0A0A3A682_9PAST|nr:5-oxoprolinase subunit PxpB [Gallibacterium anatis]KGQ63222.1 hypothetical protein IO48_01655 [Gallibacterium anatis 4895]
MITFSYTSEHSLLVLLPPPAELSKQQRIWFMADSARHFTDVEEVVVGMNNFTIYYHIDTDITALEKKLKQLWQQSERQQFQHQPRLIEIPVHYGGEFGEDLFDVAHFHQTTPQEIIRRHTAATYTVFMMGFQPGFPYLGGLPENLHTPRRSQPRTKVPAGSVGIGGSQTGVYPFTSPGGWQLIGRTEMPLFNIEKTPPVLLQAGDNVRFVAESIHL